MNKRKRKHKFKKNLLLTFLAVSILLIILIIVKQIRPMIRATAAYHASIYATDLMNDAVEQELQKIQNINLVEIKENQQNGITSVTLDMLRINQMKTGITERILHELSSEETEIVEVPLGTLLGSEIFSGRGPLIPITLSPIGLARIQMSSGMRQAGINQVLHEVVLHVEVEVSAILPGYSADAKASSDYLISQTVIVGNVPQRYSEAAADKSTVWECLDEA